MLFRSRKPASPVDADTQVSLDEQPLSLPGERYLMLYKPDGVISATTDSQQPTALDLLPADVRHGLHIAGRLDADTTGLLLLTTDGQWSHRITSPRVKCPKTYRVTLAEPIDDLAITHCNRVYYCTVSRGQPDLPMSIYSMPGKLT